MFSPTSRGQPAARSFFRCHGKSNGKRYGFAVVAVLAASMINVLLHKYLPGDYLSLYLAAIVFASLYGGKGPGTLAILLCLFKIEVFVVGPEILGSSGFADIIRVRLGLFVAIAITIVWIGDRLSMLYRSAESRKDEFLELMDSLHDAIVWEADTNTGAYSFVSQGSERLLRYSRDAWLGEPDFLLHRTHVDDQPILQKTIQKARLGVQDQYCDHRVYDLEGNAIWYHTVIHFERKHAKSLLRGLSVNVNLLKNTEEKLMNAVRSRDEVLAVVSHDLRQPISSMLLATNLLREKARQEKIEKTEFVRLTDKLSKQFENALHRMNRLIEGLLSLSKLESGNFVLDRQALNCGNILRESVELIQTIAAKKDITVQILFQASDQNLFCYCDHDQLIRVFSNLLGNAVKFTPDGGLVQVGVERPCEKYVKFFVQDTGPGIAKDQMRHLFQPYWQAQSTASQGVGLGLSIARGIVEAHGGKIWAESMPGKGSIFHFLLPVAKAESLAA